MMKKALAILMMCTMFVLSCSEEESEYPVQEPTSIEGFINRKILSDGQVAIVSSKDVLQQILPEGYTTYTSKVNFSKNNLLLIYDTSNYGVDEIVRKQTKMKDGYDIDITVFQNLTCFSEPWCIAYIVPKELKQKDVKVKIRYE